MTHGEHGSHKPRAQHLDSHKSILDKVLRIYINQRHKINKPNGEKDLDILIAHGKIDKSLN